MARQGYIHDKLDLKMLELYLLARAAGPIGPDTLAELTMRHEGVEYFDFAEATAELVKSGHLSVENERYVITEKGKLNSAACESSLPYSVRRRCDEDLAPINAALRREAQVRGEKRSNADGSAQTRHGPTSSSTCSGPSRSRYSTRCSRPLPGTAKRRSER